MSKIEYTCNCGIVGNGNTFGSDYSDHDQNCPIWLSGRIASMEKDKRLKDMDLLEVKQKMCRAQERAYHWELCFIKRMMEK